MHVPSPRTIRTFDVPLEGNLGEQVWHGTGLHEEGVRALALGAWYANNWQSPHDAIEFVEAGTRKPAVRSAIKILKNSWGVTGHDEALDTVNQLLNGMHSPIYEVVHPLVLELLQQSAPHDLRLPRHADPVQERHLQLLYAAASYQGRSESDYVTWYESWRQALKLGVCAHLPGMLPHQIRAWDQARVVFVTRASVTAGYLSADEGWDILRRALTQARLYHRNWAQFGQSFIVGFAFWYAQCELAESATTSRARHEDVQLLWLDPLSPWRAVALHPGTPVLSPTPAHDTLPRGHYTTPR